jgi:hypothetical protein
LVEACGFAGAFFAAVLPVAGLCAVLLAWAWACVPVCADEDAGFFLAAGLPAVAAVAPDATRDECFARWCVFFGGTASAAAVADSANAAIIATISIFVVFRIRVPSKSRFKIIAGVR